MKIRDFKTLTVGSLTMAVMFVAGSSTAHHSGEMFDREEMITLEGTVREFQFTNPHVWLIVDVTKEDGARETWGIESGHRAGMIDAGIFKNDLPPGAKVTVTAHPMKDGRPAGSWITVVKEDGTVLDPRTPAASEQAEYR